MSYKPNDGLPVRSRFHISDSKITGRTILWRDTHGITVSKDGMNISPNIYMDGLYAAYEEGETFRAVMDKVRRIYKAICLRCD